MFATFIARACAIGGNGSDRDGKVGRAVKVAFRVGTVDGDEGAGGTAIGSARSSAM